MCLHKRLSATVQPVISPQTSDWRQLTYSCSVLTYDSRLHKLSKCNHLDVISKLLFLKFMFESLAIAFFSFFFPVPSQHIGYFVGKIVLSLKPNIYLMIWLPLAHWSERVDLDNDIIRADASKSELHNWSWGSHIWIRFFKSIRIINMTQTVLFFNWENL